MLLKQPQAAGKPQKYSLINPIHRAYLCWRSKCRLTIPIHPQKPLRSTPRHHNPPPHTSTSRHYLSKRLNKSSIPFPQIILSCPSKPTSPWISSQSSSTPHFHHHHVLDLPIQSLNRIQQPQNICLSQIALRIRRTLTILSTRALEAP